MILGCEKSDINVDGRCKSLTIESCRKVTVKASAVLQQVEIVNCECVELIVNEYLPLVNVENSMEVVLKMS